MITICDLSPQLVMGQVLSLAYLATCLKQILSYLRLPKDQT